MPLKLNLGCGRKYLPDYVNCDVSPNVKADQHFDLEVFPYPFGDNTADEILMDNVLEHLEDVPKVMAELHRILRPGGRLRILVPYGKTDWALQDPTHKHFFTEKSLNYFAEGDPYNFYSQIRFRVLQARLYGDSTTMLHKLRNALPFKRCLRYFFYNIYDGIDFMLEKAGCAPGEAASTDAGQR
jgi:ubiquinone/menaquinone biosynthesis C-methylase UbiE